MDEPLFLIRRDDGEVMETGLTREVADQRVRTLYDPAEYEVRPMLGVAPRSP